ncbi:MAG: DNA polymerase III subunit delta [Bacteroidaceae bacterium]|nr:DNA polymerase III subunit delta [Bacteroidaceae bacterium]
MTYEEIVKDIKDGNVASVYCLMGEEPYYIDKLEEFITERVMPMENRDFDMDLLYGSDVDAVRIVDSCQQFPMLGEKRLVVVREFQQMRTSQDALAEYVKNPSPTTVLVLCHKNSNLDKRKTLGKNIDKVGVVFESKKIYEKSLPSFIQRYLKASGKDIDVKASQMLVEYVGADLMRMSSELDKLLIAMPKGESRVSASLVEAQTGMSKDFNNFELIAALSQKNKSQAAKIVKYFGSNPRSFALPSTLSVMFTFFSDLMQAYYSPEKTEKGIAMWLGKPDWKVRNEIMPAMRLYTGRRVMEILSLIRETDAAGKGVGGCKTPPGELLLELVYRILE